MDIVVRRQSEHLGRQLSDAEKDDDERSDPNYMYVIRKWEWDHLRVSFFNKMITSISTIISNVHFSNDKSDRMS